MQLREFVILELSMLISDMQVELEQTQLCSVVLECSVTCVLWCFNVVRELLIELSCK
jgi:hypothetical protein